MEDILKQLLVSVNEIKRDVTKIDDSLSHLEQRLARLEKMDSIEHRVSVNQIDLTDIKAIVEKMENFQREELLTVSEFFKKNMKDVRYTDVLNQINNRLDAQLMKIAHNEEAILMMTNKRRDYENTK